VQEAEPFGFDFALSMTKLRGFSGPSQFSTPTFRRRNAGHDRGLRAIRAIGGLTRRGG
jgi:hypothetical protein